MSPPAVRDYEVIAADDPFGVGTTSSLWFFRRPLPAANFRSATVMWDGANTVSTGLRDGLIKQARSNVTGAQQGAPAPDAVIFDVVDYENALFIVCPDAITCLVVRKKLERFRHSCDAGHNAVDESAIYLRCDDGGQSMLVSGV